MSKEMSEMQREMLSRADAIFSTIASSVGKAKDFAVEQLPDVAYQFILYNSIYYGIVLLISFLFVILGVTLMVRCFISKQTTDSNFFAAIIGCIAFILSMTVIASNLKSALMVWFAPKVFLIQEMVNLVK